MANVTETPSYDAGIYQIETTDPVLGGPNGIANAQAKGLANRTAFLKQQIDQLNSGQLTPAWIASQDYVQGELQKLDTKQSVRAATTANITLSGVQTIDGVALTVGDRVLVKDQIASAQNGIYLVGAQSWARSDDADSGTKLSSGARVAIESGSVNAGCVWYLATAGNINVGSTSLLFVNEHAAGTKTEKGLLRLATEEEAIAGLLSNIAVAPKEMKAAMEALLDIVCPIGHPIPWYESTPPNERFLIAQPSAFDKTKFPKLAAKWPSGVIPFDLRAEYIRGLDNGRGIEAGRTVLSWRDATAISNFLGKATESSPPAADNMPGIHSANAESKTNLGPMWTSFSSDAMSMIGIASYIKMRVRDVAFLYVIRAQ